MSAETGKVRDAYGSKIYALDSYRYNMSENLYQCHVPFEKDLNLDWVKNNAVIIHYCGRQKPWKEKYIGQLDVFYHQVIQRMKNEDQSCKQEKPRNP